MELDLLVLELGNPRRLQRFLGHLTTLFQLVPKHLLEENSQCKRSELQLDVRDSKPKTEEPKP